ncbi:MAG: hypothetical protein LBJ23_07265 [Tannerella sp.]|jgi:hypothetical protein|nr:hypothetical protein [Tannerella sp.]
MYQFNEGFNFDFVSSGLNKDREPFVFIKDTGGGRSVTNSAEEIVRELTVIDGNWNIVGKHLYYSDSRGEIDELLHDNHGKFIGFSFGHRM